MSPKVKEVLAKVKVCLEHERVHQEMAKRHQQMAAEMADIRRLLKLSVGLCICRDCSNLATIAPDGLRDNMCDECRTFLENLEG